MSIPKKKPRSYKRTSKPLSAYAQQQLSKLQSTQPTKPYKGDFNWPDPKKVNALLDSCYMTHSIPLHSKVLVNDSLHSHITPGMIGLVTGLLPEGYEVYFEKPLVSTSFIGGVEQPAHVFMRPQDIEFSELSCKLDDLPD